MSVNKLVALSTRFRPDCSNGPINTNFCSSRTRVTVQYQPLNNFALKRDDLLYQKCRYVVGRYIV